MKLASDHTPTRIHFGQIELNLMSQQVFEDSKEVHLSPKCFALLKLFFEHPGELLTKRQIFDAVWPHQDVGDATLNQTVSTLRKSLSSLDTSIKSIPRRGYVFSVYVDHEIAADALAQASAINAEHEVVTPAPFAIKPIENANSNAKNTTKRWRIFVPIALTLLLASGYALVKSSGEPTAKLDRISLEVRSENAGLAAAFRALVAAEIDPSVKIIGDMDVNITAADQLLVELDADETQPSALRWRWQLTSAGNKQVGQSSGVIANVSENLRASLPKSLPLRKNYAQNAITDRAFAYYSEAMRKLSSGHIKSAKPLLERALSLAPTNPIVLSELAHVMQQTGEIRVAKMYFSQLANLSEDPQRRLYARFKLAHMDNQEQDALAALEQLVMDDTEKAYRRASLYLRLGKLDEAKKVLDLRAKAGATITNDAEFGYLTGGLATKKFDHRQALQIYTQALTNPNLTGYWRGLLHAQSGSSYYQLGEITQSEAAFTASADSFDPERNLDEQFSARRMLLNMRVMRTKGCYQGTEIDKLRTMAVEQIGSVRAMTGYFSGKSLIETRCGNFDAAIATLTQSIEISRGVEELAHQVALLNRARLQTVTADFVSALRDIATIRALAVQKLANDELEYVAVRAGSQDVSEHTRICFDALRTQSKPQRLALAQQCLAAPSVMEVENAVHVRLLQYVKAGEPADLAPSLKAALAGGDAIAQLEWKAFCAVAANSQACHAVP